METGIHFYIFAIKIKLFAKKIKSSFCPQRFQIFVLHSSPTFFSFLTIAGFIEEVG